VVVVQAQENARDLKHHHVGTEHLLLALLSDDQDIPAQVLASFGVDREKIRARVIQAVGSGEEAPPGTPIPFTPGAKKVLEAGLREALSLGQIGIRPGHLLLGLIQGDPPQGLPVRLLLESEVDLGDIRGQVLELLVALEPREESRRFGATRTSSSTSSSAGSLAISRSSAPVPDLRLRELLRTAGARASAGGREQYGLADLLAVAAEEEPGLRELLDDARWRGQPDS